MAKQLIVWTVLPFGRVRDGEHKGKWRVSVVVSPRLTPEAAGEQKLGAFEAWLDWPGSLDAAQFSLRIGMDEVDLERVSKPDAGMWKQFFDENTPVAGFVYKDMSTVNLHSYAVKNVLSFVRDHYGRLATETGAEHPKLLPWSEADPSVKGMLTGVGTRTQTITFGDQQIEVPLPGFSRFHDGTIDEELTGSVFNGKSVYQMDVVAPQVEGDTTTPGVSAKRPLRVMKSDWRDPQFAGGDAGVMSNFASADEYTFYQADRFYRRSKPTDAEKEKLRPDFKDITPPPPAPDYDFHQIVASYSDYGELLRTLGLVIDFVFEDPGTIRDRIQLGNGTGVGQMQLGVKWVAAPPGEDARPRTAWLAQRDRFVPRPRTNDHAAGLLRLERSDDGWSTTKDDKPGLFDLYQVDPDGAALKTVNYTLTAQNLITKSLSLRQKHGEVTYTTGDRQPVAALRSSGIGVSQHGRAEKLAKLAAASDLKNTEIVNGNAKDVVLFAEDVHRGHRVDVARVPDLVQPGKWQTLCARDGTYRALKPDVELKFGSDEGYVSGSSLSGDINDPGEQYMHESLFRWSGWSLVAPRPGKTIKSETNDDNNLQAEVPADVADTAENGNGLSAIFKVQKGTLPRLRFGSFYRVRARDVDLAGNSLALDDPSIEPLEQASDAVGYWRFEPVDPPVLVQRERISEGEQAERMVIRSNFDKTTGEYLETDAFKDAIALHASADFAYTKENERHVVPPKSSQQQCEVHGLFDPYLGGDWQDAKKGYEVAAREAGSLYDPIPGSQIELITPQAVADVATTAAVPPELPSADNPVGDRMAGGQYIIHRQKHVETPYLPDGAAGGVAIRAIPGHKISGIFDGMVLGDHCRVVQSIDNDDLIILIKHRRNWPALQGFRLVLAEREEADTDLPCKVNFTNDGRPDWDEENRVLTLYLAKGQILRLLYSSLIHPDFLHHFGIPRWAKSNKAAEACMKAAAMGANWLMTPYRRLTMVHATQQPVCLPELIKMTPGRGVGEHNVKLNCRLVRLHGPSTGKFEIEASWKEWVDDINRPEPERIEFSGQLGEVRLAENHGNEFPLHTAVSNQLADPEAVRGDVHELSDTRFRLIQYRVRAATRFREYLPPSMYDQRDLISHLGPVAEGEAVALPSDEDAGAPVLRDSSGSTQQSLVRSSAAPKDPKLLYVVPTFKWSRTKATDKYEATRHGNGLRIWLDRPWFSSGDGELLGVVLHGNNANFSTITDDMEKLVTQWGTDPLWETAKPKKTIRDQDFPARVTAETIPLQERSNNSQVRIVGHRVHWDGERGLWFCDIELNPGATYMPFVRLALVRYQPNAIPGAKISKVVLAEFSQILPRRRIVAKKDATKLDVTLHGPDPQRGPLDATRDSAFQNVSFVNGPFETGRNRVELVLQEQKDGIKSDLGWEDKQVLKQHVVGEEDDPNTGPVLTVPGLGTTVVGTGVGPATGVSGTGITIGATGANPFGLGREVRRRAGGTINLPGSVNLGMLALNPGTSIGTIVAGDSGQLAGAGGLGVFDPFIKDPAFWEGKVKIPTGSGKRRIVLREFERFYSDNVVNEKIGTSFFPRRIIEERLVFAEVIDFDAL
ncbi:hypothetical protein [Roseovarius aestuarii]|uniref:Uncharacterized protein n=1 Tax=Roseovarius aestuarii TaxID=475083 RepID=A0A1X7BWP9_9RHOB|nr:hypothetical protein [Roseovarius aestuarii]SMC14067.1 hypothetical protein ROA7745_03931 [Roseovarius aestuarii]